MSKERVLIVDDEESIRNQLQWGLADEFDVSTAATVEDARRLVREARPSVVTVDLAMTPGSAGEEGMALLDEILEKHPLTKVVMVTGNESREHALNAIRRGATDWYGKPIQLDELKVILRRALHIRAIEMSQKDGVPAGRKRYHRLVGESEPMRRVFALIQRVAATDANVLVVGENGTGKELVAHAIHEASARRAGPFVPINCGAIPDQLLESELFGHERGAFTDAYRTREGKLELAAGGTVFLDEIGELPLLLQVKLLRFLQDKVVERVGGREPRRVDARVVAATNQDLKTMMAAGRFREDLFYRLSVVTIVVPPLRERGDDLRLLAEYFLEFYARHHKRRIKGFTQAALRAIQAHPWPGNVRELENRIQRAVILAQDSTLRPEDLELGERAEDVRSLQEARDEAERRLLIESLTRNAGNITRAARDVKVSRPTFHDLLRKHGIDAGQYRHPDVPEAPEDEDAEDSAEA
ncbi:MAG TPA: PEP-CTERM-box response regulator transcription factor [Candidatus Eisenbacteria bacterium]|nr:PEP-CTERM-box response regulator transcription factor [Candidatus Eisenbacteria bacterium]